MAHERPIDGIVKRVEHYGLYVQTAMGEAVVLIPDVSTTKVSDLRAAYEVGDAVRVRLLHSVEERGLYKATMILGSGCDNDANGG